MYSYLFLPLNNLISLPRLSLPSPRFFPLGFSAGFSIGFSIGLTHFFSLSLLPPPCRCPRLSTPASAQPLSHSHSPACMRSLFTSAHLLRRSFHAATQSEACMYSRHAVRPPRQPRAYVVHSMDAGGICTACAIVGVEIAEARARCV
jgi:hypothetical protein